MQWRMMATVRCRSEDKKKEGKKEGGKKEGGKNERTGKKRGEREKRLQEWVRKRKWGKECGRKAKMGKGCKGCECFPTGASGPSFFQNQNEACLDRAGRHRPEGVRRSQSRQQHKRAHLRVGPQYTQTVLVRFFSSPKRRLP
jgi:hypothetical protein